MKPAGRSCVLVAAVQGRSGAGGSQRRLHTAAQGRVVLRGPSVGKRGRLVGRGVLGRRGARGGGRVKHKETRADTSQMH